MPDVLTLSDLDYHLPTERIAQQPVEPRDAAKLLVYRRIDRSIAHHQVRDLPTLLPPRSVLVGNNSRVRKSRLTITLPSGKPGELLILEALAAGVYECMVGGRGLTVENIITLPDHTTAQVVGLVNEADFTTFKIDFQRPSNEVKQLLETQGSVPLPPYITESTAPDERYQTVFAKPLGSAAAPTAGLHITEELLEKLQSQGHAWETVTLHVGLGTFQPLRKATVAENTLHHETTEVSVETAANLTQAKQEGRPVIGVGTTACRTLESHWQTDHVQPGESSTSLFIYPPYQFQVLSGLLTNFHLPKSSLLLLVSALVGADPSTGAPTMEPQQALTELKRLYEVAIEHQYRFFSFGDAMLIL